MKILIHDRRGRYQPEIVARFTNVYAALHNICIDFNVPFPAQVPTANIPAAEVEIVDENNLTRIAKKTRDQITNLLLNIN